jgi:hypothetical protein
MATSVLIPLEQYLNTSYRPDREYIDGEVVERKMGKFEHGRVQALLAIWFGSHEREWHIQTVTEWRTQVSGRSWVEATRLEVAGSPIHVELSSLFSALDDSAS